MKLSESDKYKGQIFGFIKFTDYIESLLKGDLYMSSFKTFIDKELESGERGMGDRLEAAHVYSQTDIKFINPKTEEVFFEASSDQMYFRLKEDEKRPVYCMFAITSDMLEVIEETDDFYRTKISLPQEQIGHMLEKFSNKLVLINANEFINRVSKEFKSENYSWEARLVEYDNYAINNSVRTNSYKVGGTDAYFWKDIFFKDQAEYRIVLTDQEIEGSKEYNIGNLSDIAHVFDAKDFFSDMFEMIINKN